MAITAVNPATGERLELVNGQWVPAGGAATPAPMAAPLTVGTPRAERPRDPLEVQKDQLDIQLKRQQLATKTPNPENDVLKDAISGLGVDELLTGVKRAREQVKTGWATGIPGALGGIVPGSTRNDFKAMLSQIQGGIILEKLQALKEASKTGASGMGALSEKEGERLAASVAALNENMSADELERSFQEIERHAKTLQAVRDGKDPSNPAVAKQYGIAAPIPAVVSPPPTGGNGGGDTPPGMSELSDDQKRAYAAFVSSHNGKPDPKQLKIFLEQLTGKTVTNADAIAASLAQGQAPNTAVENLTYKEKVNARLAAEDKLGLGENPATTLAMQGGTLGISDEAAGVGNALSGVLSAPFTGRLDLVGDYRIGRDVERQRIENAREQLGYGGTAIEGISGLASAGPSALAAFSPRAAVGAAATAGALGGWGSGEGTQDSLVRGVGGAAAGAALQGVGNVVARRLSGGGGMAPQLAEASKAENVDLLKPMVDPNEIGKYGALESNVYSQPIIRGAAARVRGQIEDRAEALGRGGTALDELSLGAATQSAARAQHGTLKATRTRLYNRADASYAADGNPDIPATKAIAAADAQIAELSRLPQQNAGEIEFLNGLKADLSQPSLKLQDIRNLRTGLRSRLTDNLLRTKVEARANEILDVARDDIEAAVSPKTANAYRRADMFEAQRRDYVRNVIEKFIGTDQRPLEAGKAFQRLKALASPRGDGKRLAAFYRRLDPSEQNDVAASFADYMGHGGEDEPFSTARWLKQTKTLSPSAQRTIFGPAGEQSIKNLRLLSQKLEMAEKDINRSRSASTLERQGWRLAARNFISTIAGIGGGSALATGNTALGAAGIGVAGATMGASAFRRVLSARAMVNPRVTRWLAQAADVNSPRAAAESVRKLGLVISREPALANELTPIYDFLQGRVSQPLAAQPQTEGGNGENQ